MRRDNHRDGHVEGLQTDRNRTDVEIIDRQRLHDGFFRLDRVRLRHRRHDGTWTPQMDREVMIPYSAVAVLPYDPDADAVVLLEQFRIGAFAAGRPAWVIETVGGMIDDGEPADSVARRETLEETGLAVRALERVYSFMPTPGGVSEAITLYCGIVDASEAGGVHGVAEEHEDIRLHRLSADDALALLQRDAIDSAYTIIALQWLAMNRSRLRASYAA